MSDQKLRELERRWKETGAVEDEAAYLLERVRVGNLTRERLELAAYCGHEGALLATAMGSDGIEQTSTLLCEQWEPHRYGLHTRGREWILRASRWGPQIILGFCTALRVASELWQGMRGDDRIHGGVRLQSEIESLVLEAEAFRARSPTAPPEEWPTYVYREEIHLVLAARGLVWAAIHAERLEWVDHVVAACANTVDFYGELQGDFPQGGVAVEPEPDPLHWSWWSERVDQCFLLATAPVRARMTDLAEGA